MVVLAGGVRSRGAGAAAAVAGAAMVMVIALGGCSSNASPATATSSSATADPSTLIVVPSGVRAPANLNDTFLDEVALPELKADPGLQNEDFSAAKCYFRLENETNKVPGKWLVPSPTSSGGWNQSLVVCGPLEKDSVTSWWIRGVILNDEGNLTFGPAVPGGPDRWQPASAGEMGFRFDGSATTTG